MEINLNYPYIFYHILYLIFDIFYDIFHYNNLSLLLIVPVLMVPVDILVVMVVVMAVLLTRAERGQSSRRVSQSGDKAEEGLRADGIQDEFTGQREERV